MHLPASIENPHGDMNSYSCAAGVITQCLFDDAIDGQVNEGVCAGIHHEDLALVQLL